MSAVLTFLDHLRLDVSEDSYARVDVKRFSIPDRLSSRDDVLDALLRSAAHRDTYLAKDSHLDDNVDVHGPYLVDVMRPGFFEPVSGERAESVVRDYFDKFDGLEANLAQVIEWIDESPDHYLLAIDGDSCGHQNSWILEGFVEIVLINLETRSLSLLVLAED